MTDTTQHMDRALPTSRLGGSQDNARSEREFARARRHSRLVTVLKLGLPVAALFIIGAGVAVTWLARSLPENVTVSSTSLDDGRIVMQDPRMSGTDSNDRPYSMIAQRAIQSLTGGGIDLEQVRANVSVSDSATADIVAAKGHFDPKAQTLQLTEKISVETTNGMSMTFDSADIDMKSGNMVASGPVAIELPNQSIRAGTFTVRDRGKSLSFGDRVKLTLTPSPPDEAPDAAQASSDKTPPPKTSSE